MKFFRRMGAKDGGRPDYFLLAAIFLLTVAGLAILTSAASDIGKIKFNDSYYYLKHQLLSGMLFGAVGFLLGFLVPYKLYRDWALIFLVANLLLLTLVFTHFGVQSGGSTRWLTFGSITFQPAEFLKLFFILYVAAFFSHPRVNRAKNVKNGIAPFLIVSGVMALLLILQPATSTVVILLVTGMAIFFLSGASWKHMAMIAGAGGLVLAILVLITPYRLARVKGFLNRSADTQGSNYHLNQALIALGSGGTFGVGYGQSTAKVSHLPEVVDDSIFAVVGQELGFIGAGSLVALFAILVFRLFWLAYATKDRFGKLILIGFGTIIALQSLVNIGAISGLLPLTGVPLPFVSYGGTALAVFLTMGGVAANISKHV
jgi:cell division protein FtsW